VERETLVFRALADPTRRAVYQRLTRGELTVKELTAHFPVSQPAISQHLAALREAGLVTERRQGRFAHYRVRRAGLRPLLDWIEHYQAFWLDRLERLKALMEELDE
jgi:DNA-binding transcriptional ArsR family regulator